MLDTIPWKTVKRGIAAIRRRYYRVEWPDRIPSIKVDADLEAVEAKLRRTEAFEGTPYSYSYEGEELNLRRPWGLDEDGRPLELHVRGRQLDGHAELAAHVEYSRYEEKTAHVEAERVDWEAGAGAMSEIVPDIVVED